jgi:hypothetical protein
MKATSRVGGLLLFVKDGLLSSLEIYSFDTRCLCPLSHPSSGGSRCPWSDIRSSADPGLIPA